MNEWVNDDKIEDYSALGNSLADDEVKKPIFPTMPTFELSLVLVMVALMDILVYQGGGGLAHALLILSFAGIIYFKNRHEFNAEVSFQSKCVLVVIGLLAFRSFWQASDMSLLYAFLLTFVLLSSLSKFALHLLEMMYNFGVSWASSFFNAMSFLKTLWQLPFGRAFKLKVWLPILIPLAVSIVFVLIFQMANPIVDGWMGGVWTSIGEFFSDVGNFFPTFPRVLFWVTAILVAVYFLFPLGALKAKLAGESGVEDLEEDEEHVNLNSIVFWSSLNTLILLNVLFFAYNLTDLRFIWLEGVLPANITLAEYAQDGALWLTIALALTSIVLGVIFKGKQNFAGNMGLIRILAWVWVAQNFLLATGTYRRLMIYIDFNGLTYLRFLGAFGITAVVLGMIVVVLKIKYNKNFLWMMRRQVWMMLGGLLFLFFLPTEYLEKAYNTRMILNSQAAGVHPAAYQILGQELTSEGVPGLIPLLQSPNRIIREGVAAVLLGEQMRLKYRLIDKNSWKYFEMSSYEALEALEKADEDIRNLVTLQDMEAKIDALRANTSASMGWRLSREYTSSP